MGGIDKSTFKQIFYDHWDAFKQTYPRFDSPDYNDTILKMLREKVSNPAIEKDIDQAWKNYPKGFVAFLQNGEVPLGGKGLQNTWQSMSSRPLFL